MAQTVKEVMTPDPVVVDSGTTLRDVASDMASRGIGAEIVTEGDRLAGIVTDRDIVVRGVAKGLEASAAVGEVCSGDVFTLEPDSAIDDAIALMRERSVRRVPVVENDRPVGIVSLGDLALERDPNSALADISGAPDQQ